MTLPGLMRDGEVKPDWDAEVDLSLEICRGLVGVWTFSDVPINDGPAATYDALGFMAGTYNATGMTTKPGLGGVALYFPHANGANVLLPLNSRTNLSADLSIASRFRWEGGTPNYNPLLSKWDAAGVQGYGLSLNPSSKLRCDSYNTSGSVLNGNTTIAANTWYDALYSLGVLNQQLFLNGLPDATPNANPIMPGTGGTTPRAEIGGDNGNSGGGDNRGWFGLIEYVFLWNRALSQEEAAQIHAAPYQIFAPSPVRRFYSIAAAAVSAIAGLSRSVARAAAVLAASGAMAGLSAGVAMASAAPPSGLGAMAGLSAGVSRDLAAPPSGLGSIAGIGRGAGSGLGTLRGSASMAGLSRSVGRAFSAAPVDHVISAAPDIVLPTSAVALNDGITSAVPLNDGITSAVEN